MSEAVRSRPLTPSDTSSNGAQTGRATPGATGATDDVVLEETCPECGTTPVGKRFNACATCKAAKAATALTQKGTLVTFQIPDANDHVIQSVIDQALALGIIELVGMDATGQPVYRGTRGLRARLRQKQRDLESEGGTST